MSAKPDGGPAFPVTLVPDRDGTPTHPGAWMEDATGMTLRDYFAAKAMAAMLIHHGDDCDGYRQLIAANSYKVADVMIAERNKTK